MKQMPLISVIVPVYKVEKYLDQCIRSIAEQTYAHLEILLVDDGSPDGCGAICDAWAAKDSRIRVIHKENGGAGHARNVGMDQARGDLIGFIDSDDYIEPHMYAHLESLMTEDVDLAECTIALTEADDLQMEDGSNARVCVVTGEEAMALHIRDEIFCQTPPNKLYRRSVIGDIRFPVGNLIDDEFFTYRVIGNCRKLAHSSCCMYAHRQQQGRAMTRPFSLKRLEGVRAKRQRLQYLQERMPNLVEEAQLDLFMTSLYAMQGSVRHLKGEELVQARAQLREAVEEAKPLLLHAADSGKKRMLLRLAQTSFEGTARLLNFLIDIHLLT